MPSIFVTGATGYIGGDAVYAILSSHPDYEITCLARDAFKGAELVALHPSLRVVHGSLDDSHILEEEAAKADIVLNFANGTHGAAARALANGLARRQRPGHGYLVHTIGTGTMIYDDVVHGRFGEPSDKIYNDLDGLPDVIAVSDFAKVRGAETTVREAGIENPDRIRTAIVSTASVYGLGRGLVEYRASSIHELIRCTIQRGHGLHVGAGRSAWHHVHIRDLSDVYVKLVEHATGCGQGHQNGEADRDSPSVWGGTEGFYFVENGEHVWGELATAVRDDAVRQGLVSPASGVVSVDAKEAAALAPMANFFWGCNARVQAGRARQALGWRPTGASLREELRGIVRREAERLGVV